MLRRHPVASDHSAAKMGYFHLLLCLSLMAPIVGSSGFKGFKGLNLADNFKVSKPAGPGNPSGLQGVLKSGLEAMNTSLSDLLQRMSKLETTRGPDVVQDEVKLIKKNQDTLGASLTNLESSVKRLEENVAAVTEAQEKNLQSLISENERLQSLIRNMGKTKPEMDSNNLALNKPTTSSSTGFFSRTAGPVDGSLSADYWSGSCFRPIWKDKKPWWQVDLGSSYVITEVNVTARWDRPTKLSSFTVEVFTDDPSTVQDTTPRLCYGYKAKKQRSGAVIRCLCTEPVTGRYLRITEKGRKKKQRLVFCEVQVFGGSKSDKSK